ncbi:hypothetical protein GKJPGBOP_00663 [Streptomyces paromomycinus]|uniref:Uncharacterized protein n=1 Tax=Streptomyces paromomycinus TaxID=92743 RepID=A0A401VVA1_STREY|nr:hypothetical protein GKJPGBOP_00663 [Streptomyces paromomycinus]
MTTLVLVSFAISPSGPRHRTRPDTQHESGPSPRVLPRRRTFRMPCARRAPVRRGTPQQHIVRFAEICTGTSLRAGRTDWPCCGASGIRRSPATGSPYRVSGTLEVFTAASVLSTVSRTRRCVRLLGKRPVSARRTAGRPGPGSWSPAVPLRALRRSAGAFEVVDVTAHAPLNPYPVVLDRGLPHTCLTDRERRTFAATMARMRRSATGCQGLTGCTAARAHRGLCDSVAEVGKGSVNTRQRWCGKCRAAGTGVAAGWGHG